MSSGVHPSSVLPLRVSPLRALVVLLTFAVLVVHVVWPYGPVADATYLVGVCGGGFLAWVGARRLPADRRLVPYLIAAGLALSAFGDLIWLCYSWGGTDPAVSIADIPYFASYVGLGAALFVLTLVHDRTGRHLDFDSVLNSLTIVTVSILVLWNVSISSIVADTSVSAATRTVWAAYPIADAVVLALVVRALMLARSRSSVGPLFVVGIACWLASDLGYLLLEVSGTVSGLLDDGWMLGAVLMGASTWRRSSGDDPLRAPRPVVEETGAGLGQLGIAILPLLVPPALELVTDLQGREGHRYEAPVGMAILLVLAFLRTARLLHSENVARAEARTSRDVAMDASRAKSAFLATMSHEIRTPMNGVIGLTGLLLTTELDDRQRQYARGVEVAAESLMTIINDILDFSKIEAGKLQLEILDFNLLQVVEEVTELMAESALGKDLELLAYCSPELPLSLRGDPSRLRQVLLNLASNAVKFTEDGEVVLRAHLEDLSEEALMVRFEITDTGPGIAEGEQQRLFEPFSQADSSTTRRYGGTGLGLAICRQLVSAMGGTLGVTSTPGRGSTFWFTLPLQLALDPTVAPTRSTAGLDGLRVLVVDDNQTNRLILTDQLSAWGMRPDAVADGESALRALAEAARTDAPYSLALLDLCMPVMDGLDLAAQVSQQEALASVGLVLLTSGPDVTAVEASAAGIAARLTKPVHLSSLHSVLQEVTAKVRAGGPGSARHRDGQAPGGRGHVLVVEDNEVNQMVAVGILEHLGYTTELAANGLEALTAFGRAHFSAVLMDCQMPEMDGYDATHEIRLLEGSERRTPVIAMTAGVTPGERQRCLSAGMDDYVSKPVNPDDLETTLGRWLHPSSP
ncbi:MAG: response regulator [Nocardioides sp.]|jgi:two-component system sensor histidine kinase/response regulator|nr:response regulator [Nocardioides sp.]